MNIHKNKFDFIYLHGIIQHTDHPGKTLANLLYSLKTSGHMWFFFSRSGTLIRFIGEIQRRLTKFLNIDDFYAAMKIIENALFLKYFISLLLLSLRNSILFLSKKS